ncbi:MAG: PPK2 family polyphosphate:nucleotide phosphotransferase [Saprospiraceae bacterium]|jgi:PPK2 family polyphosphate:nucleotide phosphotransferase
MTEFNPQKLRITPDSKFTIQQASTEPMSNESEKSLVGQLEDLTKKFSKLQRKFYADDSHSLLLVFQAMDAAGKDSTIRAVTSGVNPAGFQVSSFKQPSKNELDHDFLWRSATRLPERGRIGIFNRSYYEETLVVRVHPEYLDGQRLPNRPALESLWQERYESIVEHERHLDRNGTKVIKFWLNVSKDEQKKRFLDRLRNPKKYWKFSDSDLKERALWSDYMEAYEAMLNATTNSFAPWYAIPADNKLWMRVQVAKVIVQALEDMNLEYPEANNIDLFDEFEARLLAEK